MFHRVASITVLVLAVAVAASAKARETVQIQVDASQTKIHGTPPAEAFEYTDIMFVTVDGKKITYECDQHGDDCPAMESGKVYMASRDGNVIYVSVNSRTGKASLIKYKELGTW